MRVMSDGREKGEGKLEEKNPESRPWGREKGSKEKGERYTVFARENRSGSSLVGSNREKCKPCQVTKGKILR